MIDATRILDGCAFLIRDSRPIHQSIGLSEMSSQFHDECRTDSGRAFIEMLGEPASVLMNFVFGPATFATAWRPIVFVTTPPHPASNARMMFVSDSVGGADARRNGFSNRIPVKTVDRFAVIAPSVDSRKRCTASIGRSDRESETLVRSQHQCP